MNKKGNIYIIGIVLVFALLIFLGAFDTASFIDVRDSTGAYGTQTRADQFAGQEIILNAPTFSPIFSEKGNEFCGNDKTSKISDSYIISGNTLTLMSSTESSRGCPSIYNYISGEVELPAGKIEGTCKVSLGFESWNTADSNLGQCIIEGLDYEKGALQEKDLGQEYGYKGSNAFSDTFSYTLSSPKKLKFMVKTQLASYAVNDVVMTVKFTPSSSVTSSSSPSSDSQSSDDGNALTKFWNWLKDLLGL